MTYPLQHTATLQNKQYLSLLHVLLSDNNSQNCTMKTITDYILQFNPFILTSPVGLVLAGTVGLFAVFIRYVTWWPRPRPTQVCIFTIPFILFSFAHITTFYRSSSSSLVSGPTSRSVPAGENPHQP